MCIKIRIGCKKPIVDRLKTRGKQTSATPHITLPRLKSRVRIPSPAPIINLKLVMIDTISTLEISK